MEQKDYLLREIEKIGMLLRAILNSLLGKKENMAITIVNQYEKTKELLINEMNFDLDLFLSMDESATKNYIANFKGINPENLQLLAEIVFNLGTKEQVDNKNLYIIKAIQLYELCEEKDKTFSIEREKRIKEIRNNKTPA